MHLSMRHSTNRLQSQFPRIISSPSPIMQIDYYYVKSELVFIDLIHAKLGQERISKQQLIKSETSRGACLYMALLCWSSHSP